MSRFEQEHAAVEKPKHIGSLFVNRCLQRDIRHMWFRTSEIHACESVQATHETMQSVTVQKF